MKRFFKLILCSIIVSTVFVFGLTGCSDGVETMEVGTVENADFQYSINKIVDEEGNTIDHFAKVTKYIGDEDLVNVPAQVYYAELSEEINVTSIGSLAFYDLPVKNVVLAEGITIIENFSFGYSEIMTIDIPSTIESIGDWSFVNCMGFREIIIRAETSPELGIYAFKYYDEDGSKDYEIDPELKIKVPSLEAYQTEDVLNNWIEYQDNLEEV
ncbi:MAG: leucine-rich repeat protein [Bacillota bacterium]